MVDFIYEKRSPVVEVGHDTEITKTCVAVGFEHTLECFSIDVDKYSTGPLTEEEAWALRHKLGVRMATKGFRSMEEVARAIKDYLSSIGKSNEGKVFRPGMGWVDKPCLV